MARGGEKWVRKAAIGLVVSGALAIGMGQTSGCLGARSDEPTERVGVAHQNLFGLQVTEAPGTALPEGPVMMGPGCTGALIQRDVVLFAAHCLCAGTELDTDQTTTFSIFPTSDPDQQGFTLATSTLHVLPEPNLCLFASIGKAVPNTPRRDLACAHLVGPAPLASVPALNPVYTGADAIVKLLDTLVIPLSPT
jgi:hypothetical protein